MNARTTIANRIVALTGGNKKSIYLAPWDDRRISWEENTLLGHYYYEDLDKFYEIMDKATEGTGYFVELINSVEGHICKI